MQAKYELEMQQNTSVIPEETAPKKIDLRAILRMCADPDDLIEADDVDTDRTPKKIDLRAILRMCEDSESPFDVENVDARARCLHAISADARARHRVETVQALSPGLVADTESGVVVIRAPMASGKTQRILAPISAREREIVAITPRVSLAAELAQRLQLTHYRLGRPQDVDRGVCLCVPSIANETWGLYVAENSPVVLIDEVEQVLRFLTARECSTQISGPDEVYAALRNMIRRARLVVVADAHVSDLTIRFLEECRPAGEAFRIIEMPVPTPAPEAQVVAEIMDGKHCIARGIARILGEIESGNKVWIATDSVAQSDVLHAAIMRHFPDRRVIYINKKSKENKEQAAFLASADHLSREYDVVIASPVISSGLSVEHRAAEDRERFDLVAFIGGSGLTVCPTDALQMMRRVRYARRILVAIEPSNFSRAPVDEEGVALGVVDCERIEGRDASIGDYQRFVARVRSIEALARQDFVSGLLDLMIEERWVLLAISGDEIVGATDPDEIGDLRDALRAQHVRDLIDAPALTHEEVAMLRGGRVQPTPEQHIALQAWDIRRDLAIPPGSMLTEATVKAWDGGRCLRRVELYIALRREEDSVRPEDLDVDMMHRKYVLAASRLIGEVLAGIDLAAPIDPFTASVIIGRAWERRFAMAVAGLVDASWTSTAPDVQPPPAKIHMRVLGEIFRRCGLRLKKDRQVYVRDVPQTPIAREGGRDLEDARKRVRLYSLDADAVAEMSDYADRIGRQIRDDAQRKALAQAIRAEFPDRREDDEEQIRAWSDGNLSIFYALRAERERQRELELSSQMLYISLRKVAGETTSSADLYDRWAQHELS